MVCFVVAVLLCGCVVSNGQNGDAAQAEDGGNGDSGQGADGAIADAPRPDWQGVTDCSEIGAISCFSNLDCAEANRCQNVGTELDPVPCCIAGQRGTVEPGQDCDEGEGETQCDTAICITNSSGSRCSTTCQGPNDCPQGMQSCTFIAFSESDDMWCFPE